MSRVLVTGGKGQLALCIKDAARQLTDFSFLFVDVDELDIAKPDEVKRYFDRHEIDYCINCAAYTAVDKAESEAELAKVINVDGPKFLAEACQAYNAVLIQISTDFVFDGRQTSLYSENDEPNPLGVYGNTKWLGEKAITSVMSEYFIIRTAWLYSEHGHNFMKTMLRLGGEREQLGVVCDQIGTPTYAGDLARAILEIISENQQTYGIYHFSNEGVASWYDFAYAIFEIENIACALSPIKTAAYKTPAERPAFSVLDKSKIKGMLNLEIPHWRKSLQKCLEENKL